MAKRTYRSMQGKIVDMELLSQKHELAPAIGNARMNARGDLLGPGGKIVKKREDVMAEYYENNPNAVRDEQYVRPKSPEASKPAQITNKKTTTKKEVKTKDENDQTDS
jgi:hypothetical protein